MCQLLGMNCNVPTDICFSFSGFRKRGGETGIHRDGWVDMRPGTLWMFCDGNVYDQCDTKPIPFKTMADLETATD